MPGPYQPPYNLTPPVVALVSDISEALGRLSVRAEGESTLKLRRSQRIRTIQASLAIENNSLSVEQVTAVLAGKRVLGPPRELQEVRNAFAAYQRMPHWQAARSSDLLEAHAILMAGLLDTAGHWRRGGVGIYRNGVLVHMAPPASRVAKGMKDLLSWLARTDIHPLVASCVFHYEFEFIHPFADGNGRVGRLWQTLLLSRWKPLLAWLPVETVIHDQQEACYAALAAADSTSNATPFVEYMLRALLTALREALASDQVSDQVNDQADAAILWLLEVLKPGESVQAAELMRRLRLRHRPTFRKNYLDPAIRAGFIEMTSPDAPRSPAQRYRRKAKARAW